jgi:hypothetical protein
MLVGHYGVGLAAKRVVPGVSLGTLFLAVQLADMLWPIFLIAGLEHVRLAPGITRLTPLDFYDYPISHSLVGLLGWSAAAAIAYRLLAGKPRAALVVGAAVLSHWFLDLVVHRPDLPVLPRGPYVGFGLWNSLPGSLLAEGLVFGGGIAFYVRGTRARDAAGRWALTALVAVLVAAQLGGYFGPPPPGENAVAYSALALWLVVPWGYWIDRHREDV